MEIVLGKLIDAIVSRFRRRPIVMVALVLTISIALMVAELEFRGTF